MHVLSRVRIQIPKGLPELRRRVGFPAASSGTRRERATGHRPALRPQDGAVAIEPYHLRRGAGRSRNIGIDITVKAGERQTRHGAAVIEFVTRKGEEPGNHVHPTEDEMFYVLEGRLTFTCAGKRFDAAPGSFVFLPKGLTHNYEIDGDEPVRLLVITAPPRARKSNGWGGFVGDLESGG